MYYVGFHTNELTIRGTEVALFDYAHYNETLLGHHSYIFASANGDLSSLPKFKNRFEVFLYQDFNDCQRFVQEHGIQCMYYIKAGNDDRKVIPGIKNAIHAVFQHKVTHGDTHAYVSEWLADTMGEPDAYVPHIVHMPVPNKNYRKKLNISEDAIVIGRYGGYGEFDLPFVHDAIVRTVNERSDIYFLLMNTRPFTGPHPNIIHIDSTFVPQNKSNFIDTCDYMLHARNYGESFGLSICEFLFHDKPIISWKSGLDRNHIKLLQSRGIWYNNGHEAYNILKTIGKNCAYKGTYSSLVSGFTPETVMNRFNKILLGA